LLLVQSKALDEAPYKLSRAIAKLEGITFWSLAFSYWFDKPRFLTEGRLATVLIIPSSWGSQLGGYLPASSTLPTDKVWFIPHIDHSMVHNPTRNFQLRNILHVPTASRNLLSVRRFTFDNHVFQNFIPSSFLLRIR
jgi:hypothetical protein